MSTRTLTLDQVEKAFAIWRNNKNGKRTIPDKLWGDVKALINLQGVSPVLKRLKISWEQARNKGLIPTKYADGASKNRKAASPFIKISQVLPTAHDRRPQLTFQRGDAQLLLNDPSNEQIQLFINMLQAVN
jgi:hypothetical protein